MYLYLTSVLDIKDVKMYTKEEPEMKIEEFRPTAKKFIEDMIPTDARKMVQDMNPEDAFIFGSLVTSMVIERYDKYIEWQ